MPHLLLHRGYFAHAAVNKGYRANRQQIAPEYFKKYIPVYIWATEAPASRTSNACCPFVIPPVQKITFGVSAADAFDVNNCSR